MNLPNDVEFIFVDDGSNPPLKYSGGIRNFAWYYTNDKRPWTQGLARNLGAKQAKGEYFLFTDIDHIITKEAIEAVRQFDGDKMVFVRYFGILNTRGNIICDAQSMLNFGLDKKRYKRRGLCGGIHGNTYAIKSDIFHRIGGYDRQYCESGFHVGGIYMSEERQFNIQYDRLVKSGNAKPTVTGPDIYCYPVSRFHKDKDNNPYGLFHSLSLEQTPQPLKS